MKRTGKAARARVTVVAAALAWTVAAATARGDEPREAMIVELQLQQVASELLEVPELGDEPGIPVVTVLEWLEVPFEMRQDGAVIEGYLGGRARHFVVRGSESLEFEGEVRQLGADDAAWFEGELFLASRIWREVLGVEFQYQPMRLRVLLRPDYELPVYRRRQMDRARRYREPWIDATDPADYWLEPAPGYIGGHVVDWGLRTSNLLQPGEVGGTNLRLAYGGEVLGGALQVGASARPTAFDVGTSRITWSRAWDHPALRELQLGGLASPGPGRRQLVGAMATNAPVYPVQRFGFADLLLNLPPSAPVDVLLGNQLLDHDEAAADGSFAFRAPLRFGHNRLELHYLDEYGELRSDDIFVRVPREMMRKGEVYYHVASGADAVESGLTLTTGQLAWGATPWLSLTGGSEALAGFSDEYTAGLYPYGSALVRLDPRTHMHLEGSTAGRLGGMLDFASASGWKVVASHHELRYHPFLARSSFRRDSNLRIAVPFRLFGYPAGAQLHAREAEFRAGRRSSQVRSSLLFRHALVGYMTAGYEWRGDVLGWEHDRGNALVRWSRPLPWRRPGGRLRLGLDIEPHEGQFRRATASWSRYLRPLGVRVDLGYRLQRDAATGMHHEAALSARRYFDAAWTRSNLRVPSTGRARLHADAGGSVNWSPEESAFTFHRRAQVGRGRLLLRVRGHEVPKGSYAFLIDGRRHAIDERGEVAVESLTRERTYRVFVETSPAADPLLSTRFDEIDVHIRANRTVVVDVPLDENFELEGAVFREPAPGARRGLGSVRLQLRRDGDSRTRTIRSFQDGFVYEFGIPPGRWRLEPDPDQMARRNLVVRPAAIQIDHGADDGLAVYGGLEFVAGPAEAMTDEALQERVWAALAAGEPGSAFSLSRIFLREAPGSVAVSLATECGVGDPEAVAGLRAAVEGMGPVIALPSEDRPECVEVFARAADPADDATHALGRPDPTAPLATAGTPPVRAVPAAALLGRRF